MKTLLTSTALVCGLSSGAFASTFDFGTDSVDRLDLNGPLTQDGFEGAATGDGWEAQTLFSMGGAALTTFFNGQGSDVGDTFELTRTDGDVFGFGGLAWRTISGDDSDQVLVEGLAGGFVTGSLALTESSTDFLFAGGNAGFGLIDTLRFTVTFDGSNAMLFDDVILDTAAVPLPASLPLLIGGIGFLAFGRRRKS